MPDLDRIDRTLLRGWRTPGRHFRDSRSSPRDFAHACIKAMARSLREHGGIPYFHAFVRVLEDVERGLLIAHDAHERMDAICSQAGHHRHAKIARTAAARLIQARAIGSGSGHLRLDHELDFATEFCRELVDHHLFATMRPELMASGHFPSRKELDDRERVCRAALEPPLVMLARRLARSSDGKGLRAPRIDGYRPPSTAEIIDQPIM